MGQDNRYVEDPIPTKFVRCRIVMAVSVLLVGMSSIRKSTRLIFQREETSAGTRYTQSDYPCIVGHGGRSHVHKQLGLGKAGLHSQ